MEGQLISFCKHSKDYILKSTLLRRWLFLNLFSENANVGLFRQKFTKARDPKVFRRHGDCPKEASHFCSRFDSVYRRMFICFWLYWTAFSCLVIFQFILAVTWHLKEQILSSLSPLQSAFWNPPRNSRRSILPDLSASRLANMKSISWKPWLRHSNFP